MKFSVWSGSEKDGKRRLVASTKKELLAKIAERCSDTHVVREFHVWQSFIIPNKNWVHGVIEALGSGLTGKQTNLIGRDYLKPVEESRCTCFFTRGKFIDEEPHRRIASAPGGTEPSDTDTQD